MLALRLIERKRDGGRIDAGEWRALANAYATGHVPDYQMAAFLMACFLRGLDRAETRRAHRGDAAQRRDARSLRSRQAAHRQALHGRRRRQGVHRARAAHRVARRRRADDVGARAGTHRRHARQAGIDPRLRDGISRSTQARAQLEPLGCALIGQTEEIAPADRKMYALRDATGTVESIPLIAASIMSKKLAEGLTGLVLDVKRGSGAFLPDLERGLELASTMIELGADHGLPGRRAAHRDGPAARPRVRQRARGRGVDRRAARRGTVRSHVGDLRARRRDARARRRGGGPRCGAAHDGDRHRHGARGGALPEDHRSAGRKSGGGRRSGAAAAGGGGRAVRGAASRLRRARRAARGRPRHRRRSAAAARRWRTSSISRSAS